MNQNEIYTLPDIMSKATLIKENQTFSFVVYHYVWNQHIPDSIIVTHGANYERHMAHQQFLDDIEVQLRQKRVPMF